MGVTNFDQVTTDGAVIVTAGGLTVTAGGLTVTAGGLTITAGTLTSSGAITGTSLDTAAAGALSLGTATATSVDIGVTATATTIKGTLNTDEAVTMDSTCDVAGALTADGIDRVDAGALSIGIATATSIDIGVTATMATFKGTVNVDEAVTLDSTCDVAGALTADGLDRVDAGALAIGAATATSLDIGKTGQMTTNKGTLNVDEAVTLDSTCDVAGALTADGLDRIDAGALAIGAATATSLDIGKTGQATTNKGTFNVDEAATFDTTVGVTGATTLTGGVVADTPLKVYNVQPEGAIAGRGTDGVSVAGTTYYSQLFLAANKTITGIGVLTGTTTGTDKVLVGLYDAAGNLLANSALAGATTSTADKYQEVAFTGTYAAVGPAVYLIAFQLNGTTDGMQRIATDGVEVACGKETGSFGTMIDPITSVATTFTTAEGPIGYLY